MGRKHKPNPKPYARTARDSRRAVHVYHYSDDSHRQAFPAGRCSKCGKITNCFCDKCGSWTCENHLQKKGDFEFCRDCVKRIE